MQLKTLAGIAAMVALAACNTSGDSSADNNAEPVLIGMVNMEASGGRQTVENYRRGTEAAIRYFNAERGGLQDRPVELRACTTAGAPEASAACAHQMVDQKVIAVRGGVDFGSGAALPILKAAGIPYLAGSPLLPPDFTTDGAFTFAPGGVGNAAAADYVATTLKAKKVAVLQADDPGGRNLADAFVKPVLLRRGIAPGNITVHPEKVAAADLTGVVQAAVLDRPDAIIVLFPPPACQRIMQASAQLDVRVPMFYIEPCGAPDVLAAGGPGADGAYFLASLLNVKANAKNKDVRLYFREIEKYGEGVDPASIETQVGFAVTMTVLNRLATIDGVLNAAAVSSAFKSAVAAPGFMSHAYTCDGKQAVPAYVSVCNAHVRLYQYRNGSVRDVVGDWISAADALRQ
jgi:branched-chain amino acid transport system substrate-binding protein